MKGGLLLVFVLAVVALCAGRPQKEGQTYSEEAIKQAQEQSLIPQDADIQNVQEGIQLAALEGIPGDERVDLSALFKGEFPAEVVENLQGQIDQIGKN